MTRTVTRLFDNYADAQAAVTRLEAMGVPHADISIVASNADGRHGDAADGAARDAGKGASIGAVAGGAGGLLAGLGLLAIPGLGPVVAAGWLVSTAVGAVAGAAAGGATGGVVGALTHAGVKESDAHVYAEGVRRGGTLVSAKVDDARYSQAEAALAEAKGVDAAERGAAYRTSGWTAFDENAPAYTADQVVEERRTYTTNF
ncbi:MAG TPA: general stress protein [Caulobacteraceae bacterium]|nr:general stress protein [Caulobacteraceae bacterium]